MGRNISIIPKAPFARILLNAGAKRVSADATGAFAETMTRIADEIASKAARIARHSGRKTVVGEDVKLAAK